MIDKLPYQLTEGVTAAREGLEFHVSDPRWMLVESDHDMTYSDESGKVVIYWPETELLRYRDGEPWCMVLEWETSDGGLVPMIVCGTETADVYVLPRLAAILCDDAEAFRMLHWCVNNLGGEA